MHSPSLIYWLAALVVWLTLVVLLWANKLPSVQSIQDIAAIVNSRGGNIIWLGGFSALFFWIAMRFFYFVIDKLIEGKLSADNAVAMMGITFLTGSAFGGAFSSMLKAMSGENSRARAADQPNGDGGGGLTVTQDNGTTVKVQPAGGSVKVSQEATPVKSPAVSTATTVATSVPVAHAPSAIQQAQANQINLRRS